MNAILVDDEEVAVNALKRRVDWNKYGIDEVYIANSMKEAQELFREKVIDIMLSDVEMPQGSGLDLFEWVKSYYPKVECVYVTCHPEFNYMRKALQLGSADYVLKPIDYEELDGILVQVSERVKNRRRAESIPAGIMQKAAGDEEEKNRGDIVGSVKKYVREHIQEDIYIADIAKHVYLNEQYLMRTFKKTTGISILEFITGERLWLARELLANTNYPINRVADMVGYGNYSYFTKIFKRNVGVTPQVFRQSGAGEKTDGAEPAKK